MEKLFGTDGVRGVVNIKLTSSMAQNIANTLSKYCKNKKVIIATDTRTSGDLIKFACTVGLIDGGVNIIDIGIATTPCVAYLTKLVNADFGIMISASHNPPEYNGIKIFDSDGRKLAQAFEKKLEKNYGKYTRKQHKYLGKYQHCTQLVNKYIDFLIDTGTKLNNTKIVLDASNGAAYKIAPKVFKNLGAKVININCKNDGKNINNNCGALYPETLSKYVVKHKADVGFAFDGDADRIVVVTDTGNILDGDQILFLLAKHFKQQNKLKNNMIIGTINSNLALIQNLNKIGIAYENAEVGDKFVAKKMTKQNCNLGGEQCGHIILSDYSTTGDGVLTAVVLTNILAKQKTKISKLENITPLPQQKLNITVKNKQQIINDKQFKALIKTIKKQLDKNSRIVVRPSGTEPKIRVVIESKNIKQSKQLITKIKRLIKIIDC